MERTKSTILSHRQDIEHEKDSRFEIQIRKEQEIEVFKERIAMVKKQNEEVKIKIHVEKVSKIKQVREEEKLVSHNLKV